ncbi:MAG: sulfite exporter TauE/SafE family protein [Acidiferrobacteraceae bacterium]
MTILIYISLGAVVGLLAGMLGIGGGGIVVPALLFAFSRQHINPTVRIHLAIGTSLATIVFTALSAIHAQQKRHAIDWPVALTLAPATLIGSLASGYLAGFIAPSTLKMIFTVFLGLISIQLLSNWRPAPHWRLPSRPGLLATGFGIGALSAMIGIGGGSVTVPFLSACNVDVKRAIAISAVLGLPIALFGAAGFVLSGWHHPGLPPWSMGYVYLPALIGIVSTSTLLAPLGVKWSHHLPVAPLKRIFGLLLLGVAVQMMFGIMG